MLSREINIVGGEAIYEFIYEFIYEKENPSDAMAPTYKKLAEMRDTEFKWGYMKEDKGAQRAVFLSEKLKPYLREGDTVFDLFCGYSPLYHMLREAGCKVTGLDGAHEAITWLREKYPEATWIKETFTENMISDYRGVTILLLLGVAEPQHKPVFQRYLDKALKNNDIRVIITDTATPPSPRPYYAGYKRNQQVMINNGYIRGEGHKYETTEPIKQLREYEIFMRDCTEDN